MQDYDTAELFNKNECLLIYTLNELFYWGSLDEL